MKKNMILKIALLLLLMVGATSCWFDDNPVAEQTNITPKPSNGGETASSNSSVGIASTIVDQSDAD